MDKDNKELIARLFTDKEFWNDCEEYINEFGIDHILEQINKNK